MTAARTKPESATLQPVDAALEEEWDSLALRRAATPFMRPGWFRAWMNAFQPGRTLLLLTVRRAGELVAALPLFTTRFGVRPPVNSETPSFAPLLVDAEAADTLISVLLDHCSHINLPFVPVGEQERALLLAAERRGCRVRRKVMRRSPYTRVDDDWDEFRNEVLGRSRRKWIARRRRQLRELGELTYTVHDGESPLGDLLEEGLELEAAGWKGVQHTAVLSRPSTATFYREIARWAAENDLLRLHFLRLNGKPIAFEFALEQAGVQNLLKTAYDEELRRYGPGILICDDEISYASKHPDLHLSASLGEDDPYKLEFSTGVEEQLRIAISANNVVGTAVWTLEQARGRLGHHLSSSTKKTLVRLAQSVRHPH